MSHKADLGALFGAQKADTFLGLKKCDDLAGASASSAFIGAPAATPYRSVGAYAKNGPASLRAAIAALTANSDRYNFDIDGLGGLAVSRLVVAAMGLIARQKAGML